MLLFPAPEIAIKDPRRGPMVVSGTLTGDQNALKIRKYGQLMGVEMRPYRLVPFTTGAAFLSGFGGEQYESA